MESLKIYVDRLLKKPNPLVNIYKKLIDEGNFEVLKNDKLEKYKPHDIERIINNYISNNYLEYLKSIPSHKIDERIDNWINNQCEEFKEAAKIYKESIIYIDNEKLINAIKNVAKQITPFYENSIIILGNKKEKSNYFFSNLVMNFLLKTHGKQPKGYALNFVEAFEEYGFTVSYIDIDDMMYTGSQTIDLLHRYLDGLKFKGISGTKAEEIVIKRYYLQKNELHYVLVRPFVNEYALENFKSKENIIIPCNIINGEKLPSLKQQIIKNPSNLDQIKNYIIIQVFFNLNVPSATSVYFDYKIADIASTCSFPLISGYIPSTALIKRISELMKSADLLVEIFKDISSSYKFSYEDIQKKMQETFDKITEDDSSCKFIPFVSNCTPDPIFNQSFDEIKFQTEYGILKNYEGNDDSPKYSSKDVNDFNKCPKPFYKTIDYTYGRRRRRSKSRKSKKRKSHKRLSHKRRSHKKRSRRNSKRKFRK